MQIEIGAAIAGGAGLAGLAVWAAWRYTRAPKPKPTEVEVDFEPIPDGPRPKPMVRAAARHAAPAAAVAARPQALPPPPSSPRAHAERAPAMVLTQGVRMQDAELERRAPPGPRAPPPPMRQAPPMKSWAQQVRETAAPEVPTEWARRQVGPVEPGRVAGVCGGCGSRLSASNVKPLNVKCPVCGRAKLIA